MTPVAGISPVSDAILRDPSEFAKTRYDLIAIGGGIYGAMAALEGVRRGLSVLLIERDDFGAGASHAYLRILHGGLRYLQSLDLRRHRDSVAERRWFLRHFPDLARPVECLMPLYGEGLRRPSLFRAAFLLDAWLARDKNRGLAEKSRLASGRVISAREIGRRLPDLDPADLRGGAFWNDGFVPEAPRLFVEILRWACAFGARALNHCRVEELLAENGRTIGVRATDLTDERRHDFHAPVAVNLTGVEARDFAKQWDRDKARLRPGMALGWNLVLDRTPAFSVGAAVAPRRPDGRTYFVLPWKGRILAGTGQVDLSPGEPLRPPRASENDRMLADLNEALPGLQLEPGDISRIFWGGMPTDAAGRLAKRPVFVDHGAEGGPVGFHSVSGIKFTTARQVVSRLLTRLFPLRRPRAYGGNFSPSPLHGVRGLAIEPHETDEWRKLAEEESALSLADLAVRRSDLADRMPLAEETLFSLAGIFPGEASDQIQALRSLLAEGLPSGAEME
ncbi:MAG: FAD-dependent oxidoreductase [Desulfococcaceae bacterium]